MFKNACNTTTAKRIVFLTATRADFGKLKSLIEAVNADSEFEAHVFVTGMHMNALYGKTLDEVAQCKCHSLFPYFNNSYNALMDMALASTIEGFSQYVRDIKPNMIVVHGDRIEPLAGAIVGSLNNILVGHVEGGEVSGTIDESLRHSISKLSHLHFVANERASLRLRQMGEHQESVFVIGSPDIDVMCSEGLPSMDDVRKRYDIDFKEYGIVLYHPVTTEYEDAGRAAAALVDAVIESGRNYIVIYPNNDSGCELILEEYRRFEDCKNILVFPSLRFEYFLVALKNASFIVGNSSAGIREAPYYGIPSVNIGSRQNQRSGDPEIIHCESSKEDIIRAIQCSVETPRHALSEFGDGRSTERFLQILRSESIWTMSKQKIFLDRH